jgi:transcriptional regulator GlxA family with amidase domain
VLHDDDPSATVYVDYLARAIVARLVRRHTSASLVPSPAVPSRQKGGRQIGKAIDFMEAHLEGSLDLATIAEAAGISPAISRDGVRHPPSGDRSLRHHDS